MDDRKEITQLYYEMYMAMMKKDEAKLDHVYDDTFVLTHMTGKRQNKKEYIQSIMNGTLNYYSSNPEGFVLYLMGPKARLTGRSRMTAAVYGGEKHTWKLELNLDLKRTEAGWKLVSAKASTY